MVYLMWYGTVNSGLEKGTAYNTGLPASVAALPPPNLASVPVLAASPGPAGWNVNAVVVEAIGGAGEVGWGCEPDERRPRRQAPVQSFGPARFGNPKRYAKGE